MAIKIKNYDEMQKHFIEQYPKEAVGVIIDNQFSPCENIADDPINNFKISSDITEEILSQDFSLVHSHTQTKWEIGYDPRTPSHDDLICIENYDIKFGIVHCDGENITDILWINDEIPELLNRDYISNHTDCFTLARDYYILNYNINFGIHPRPADWQNWNPHYISQHYSDLGFNEINESELLPGDIILFHIGSSAPNHIGIYTGNDQFLHHLYNRKSSYDRLSKWNRQISKFIRHENVNGPTI